MTQEQPRAGSEIAQRVLSELPVAVVVTDLDGNVMDCNTRARKVLLWNGEAQPEPAGLDDWKPRSGTLAQALRLVANSSSWTPLALWRGQEKMELKGRGLLLEGHVEPHVLLMEALTAPHRFAEHSEQVRRLNAQLIIQRKTEYRLRTALRMADILRRELVHRVKNNLAIVSALLRTKARTAEHPEATEALMAAAERIRSIAIVHELLDARNETDFVSATTLFSSLLDYLRESICPPHIILETEIVDTELATEIALPLSLLVNELATNAIKHAFTDRSSGCVRVKFAETTGGYQLVVSDNGSGIAEHLSEAGRGTRIVNALVQQLEGELEVEREGGTKWSIVLKSLEKPGALAHAGSSSEDLLTTVE